MSMPPSGCSSHKQTLWLSRVVTRRSVASGRPPWLSGQHNTDPLPGPSSEVFLPWQDLANPAIKVGRCDGAIWECSSWLLDLKQTIMSPLCLDTEQERKAFRSVRFVTYISEDLTDWQWAREDHQHKRKQTTNHRWNSWWTFKVKRQFDNYDETVKNSRKHWNHSTTITMLYYWFGKRQNILT